MDRYAENSKIEDPGDPTPNPQRPRQRDLNKEIWPRPKLDYMPGLEGGKATGFGIMPTGRRSWQRSKYSNDIEPLPLLYPQSDLMCTRMLQILIRAQKELCKRIIERVLRGRPPTFATFYN